MSELHLSDTWILYWPRLLKRWKFYFNWSCSLHRCFNGYCDLGLKKAQNQPWQHSDAHCSQSGGSHHLISSGRGVHASVPGHRHTGVARPHHHRCVFGADPTMGLYICQKPLYQWCHLLGMDPCTQCYGYKQVSGHSCTVCYVMYMHGFLIDINNT